MSDLPLTPDDVAEIVAILDGGTFDRLEIRTSRFLLKLAREGSGDASAWTQSWEWANAGTAPEEAVVETAAAQADGAHAICAPLPGTFYRAPQPGAPPFVNPGDHVEKDAVVGIIETMKLMNPVHAEVAGEIEAILVDNAKAIDAGAVLMRIRPSAA